MNPYWTKCYGEDCEHYAEELDDRHGDYIPYCEHPLNEGGGLDDCPRCRMGPGQLVDDLRFCAMTYEGLAYHFQEMVEYLERHDMLEDHDDLLMHRDLAYDYLESLDRNYREQREPGDPIRREDPVDNLDLQDVLSWIDEHASPEDGEAIRDRVVRYGV